MSLSLLVSWNSFSCKKRRVAAVEVMVSCSKFSTIFKTNQKLINSGSAIQIRLKKLLRR